MSFLWSLRESLFSETALSSCRVSDSDAWCCGAASSSGRARAAGRHLPALPFLSFFRYSSDSSFRLLFLPPLFWHSQHSKLQIEEGKKALFRHSEPAAYFQSQKLDYCTSSCTCFNSRPEVLPNSHFCRSSWTCDQSYRHAAPSRG